MVGSIEGWAAGGAGAGTPGAHRYWRVLTTELQNLAFLTIAELEMRPSIGGADLADPLNYIEGTHHTTADGSLAFDSDPATWWRYELPGGVPGADAWVGQDFGAGNEAEVQEITIQARTSPNQNQSPRQFAVQYSDDGTNWTTAWSETTGNWVTAGDIRTFTAPYA